MKQWLRRRAVRRPVSRLTTAPGSSSVLATLHQHLGAALAHQRHRLLGGGMAVLHIDDLVGTDVELRRACGREILSPRPHQDRRDDAQLRGVQGASEGGLVARMRHGGGGGRQGLHRLDQALEVFAGFGVHRRTSGCSIGSNHTTLTILIINMLAGPGTPSPPQGLYLRLHALERLL